MEKYIKDNIITRNSGDRVLPRREVWCISKIGVGVIVFFLVVTLAHAQEVTAVLSQSRGGMLTHLVGRDDLRLETARLRVNVRQDDQNNCYGNIYLFAKARADNETHAHVQMWLRPNGPCVINGTEFHIESMAVVDYRIAQQGVRSIIGISHDGHFEYGIVGNKAPIHSRGEEGVFVDVKEGMISITGQSFEMKDMNVSSYIVRV